MSGRPEYKCLNCGHRLLAYKINTAKTRQCPRCWSYDLIDFETYERCKETVREAQNDALFPGLRGIAAIVAERGFTFKPKNTLKLLQAIERDLEAEGGR
jgi:DNA-directed RNA polymerase subunit RPC12/RpoP